MMNFISLLKTERASRVQLQFNSGIGSAPFQLRSLGGADKKFNIFLFLYTNVVTGSQTHESFPEKDHGFKPSSRGVFLEVKTTV